MKMLGLAHSDMSPGSTICPPQNQVKRADFKTLLNFRTKNHQMWGHLLNLVSQAIINWKYILVCILVGVYIIMSTKFNMTGWTWVFYTTVPPLRSQGVELQEFVTSKFFLLKPANMVFKMLQCFRTIPDVWVILEEEEERKKEREW